MGYLYAWPKRTSSAAMHVIRQVGAGYARKTLCGRDARGWTRSICTTRGWVCAGCARHVEGSR